MNTNSKKKKSKISWLLIALLAVLVFMVCAALGDFANSIKGKRTPTPEDSTPTSYKTITPIPTQMLQSTYTSIPMQTLQSTYTPFPTLFVPTITDWAIETAIPAELIVATIDPRTIHSGMCKDGTYTNAKNRQGACSKHGGLLEWYKQ